METIRKTEVLLKINGTKVQPAQLPFCEPGTPEDKRPKHPDRPVPSAVCGQLGEVRGIDEPWATWGEEQGFWRPLQPDDKVDPTTGRVLSLMEDPEVIKHRGCEKLPGHVRQGGFYL
jgi:hypothetical protein